MVADQKQSHNKSVTLSHVSVLFVHTRTSPHISLSQDSYMLSVDWQHACMLSKWHLHYNATVSTSGETLVVLFLFLVFSHTHSEIGLGFIGFSSAWCHVSSTWHTRFQCLIVVDQCWESSHSQIRFCPMFTPSCHSSTYGGAAKNQSLISTSKSYIADSVILGTKYVKTSFTFQFASLCLTKT